MYIFKQPSIGGEVKPHQDGTYLYTEPQSVIGFWWALEDCTLENGCLYGVPGSHKTVPIQQRFMRTALAMDEEDSSEGALLETQPKGEPTFDISKGVPIHTKKGDLVLLHSSFVHYSHANTSPLSRHAYAMHVVESFNTHYPASNWLQYPKGKTFTQVYASEV